MNCPPLAAGLGLTLLLGACAQSPPPEAEPLAAVPPQQEPLWVTLQEGVVWIDIDRRHEPDQLWAAAEASLRGRGFVISDRAGRIEEPMKVAGSMGGTPSSRRAEISMLVGPRYVRVTATVRPWGNDAEARGLLKRMLELLGYASR